MQRKWLVYSAGKNRIFCFCCKLFSDVYAALSIEGFSDWFDASVRLAEHEKLSLTGELAKNQG